MNFSTASHVSFVYNIYLVASVVVCVCFVCYYNHCYYYILYNASKSRYMWNFFICFFNYLFYFKLKY